MRHPDDPDIVPDTKAIAAFVLALLGLATGPMIGGVVPATAALVLLRQAEGDLVDGQGWRSGAGYAKWARRLAWTGLGLALTALVWAVVAVILQGLGLTSQNFPPTVN